MLKDLLKEWGLKALDRLGMGAIILAMFVYYYQDQAKRWSDLETANATRWQTLFELNQKFQKDASETIKACCFDRYIEMERMRRGAP